MSLLMISGVASPFLLGVIIWDGVKYQELDRTRPPMEPIVIECLSPTGQKFHTDIGILFEETSRMKYTIIEYDGTQTTFEGFCSSNQEKK